MASLQTATLVYQFSSLREEISKNFTELSAQRAATDQVIVSWAAELTDQLLSSSMRYSNSQGQLREHPCWVAVARMFNHQTHHRSQLTTLLYQQGYNPGVTDFIAYVT